MSTTTDSPLEKNTSETEPISKLHKAICLLFCAILSGLLLSVCFPGMGSVGGVVWVWAFPLLLSLFLLKGKKLGFKGFAIGYVAGLTFWLFNLKWLFATRELDFVSPGTAALAWIAMSAYLACYFGIFSAIVAKWANPWAEPQQKKHTNRIDAKIAAKRKEAVSDGKYMQSFKESLASVRLALLHASLWAVLEWVRSWMFTGFSWNGLGAAFHYTPVFAQSAELFGVVALSFFPMFICSIIFQVVCRMVKEANGGKIKPHWDLAVGGLVAAGLFGFGISRMKYFTDAPAKEVSFLLVQQNQSLNQKHAQESFVGNMMAYQQMSRIGLDEIDKLNEKNYKKSLQKDGSGDLKIEKADFIVWPESALLSGILHFKDINKSGLVPVEQTAVDGTTSEGSHYLLTGANEYHFNTAEGYDLNELPNQSYNSIGLFRQGEGSADLIASYKKNHLVLFGEYIPFRETFPFLEKLMGGPMGPNFVSGNDTEPLKVNHNGEELQLIGSVCFEDTVGRLTRKSARAAHQVIINTTNDGWFCESEESQQHLANAKFRSIELRRPMVRAANTGVSCIVNVKGSIKRQDGTENAIVDENGSYFTDGTLYAKARVLTDAPLTIYAVAGDWFIGVCGGIFIITFISTLRKRSL